MKELQLALVIPVYNEEACIQEVLCSWVEVLNQSPIDSYCLLVYDDGSTDDSCKEIQKLAMRFPVIRPFHHENIGHGPTLLKGYATGFQKAEWVLQIDSDNEINPGNFPDFWNQRVSYDFVIGKRQRNSPLIREFITSISRKVIHILCGDSIYDVNCPYRLLRSEAFVDELTRIPPHTFAPNLLISGLAIRKKMRILEVPIIHTFRETGHASIRKFKLIRVSFLSFIQTLAFFLSRNPYLGP